MHSPIITTSSHASMVNTCKSRAERRSFGRLIVAALRLAQLEGLRKSWHRYTGWCSLSAVKTVCCPPKNNTRQRQRERSIESLFFSVIQSSVVFFFVVFIFYFFECGWKTGKAPGEQRCFGLSN